MKDSTNNTTKKPHTEYFIWCDESLKRGRFYSNFYGGVLIKSEDVNEVKERLKNVCDGHNVLAEIKWNKVTSAYLEKYKCLMDAYFDLLEEEKIKVRIMFTKNSFLPKNLTDTHKNEEFFILYYQFIKNAFGLQYSNNNEEKYIRLYFDYLPDKKERCNRFKEFILGLQSNKKFIDAKIKIRKTDISEVKSHDHLILQFLDVILGSMAFRLNDMHKEKIPGSRFRGNKTKAKEALYKHIHKRIRKIYPNFNIGTTTSREFIENIWKHPYRHWMFKSKNSDIDTNLNK